MIDLKTTFIGLQLKNPIIIGSSGLTNSVEKIIQLEEDGAGAVVLKSLFEEQILVEMHTSKNDDHYDYPEAHDYASHYRRERSINEYLELIQKSKASVTIPIIASVNCINGYEWSSFAEKIEKAGADALEINISLLPSDINVSSSENEQKYFDIIENVKKHINIPIILKMSRYSSGLAQLVQKLSWTKNVDAFVLFNRYYSPDIDLEKMKIVSSNVFSSPEENSGTLRWIALLSDKIQLPLVASTGIHDSEAFIKQLLAGAQAVQIVSTIYKNGNKRISEILDGIESWMEKNDYSSINDFRGKLNFADNKDTKFFERVQFMKYYNNNKS